MINIFVGFVIVTFQSEGESSFQDCALDKNQVITVEEETTTLNVTIYFSAIASSSPSMQNQYADTFQKTLCNTGCGPLQPLHFVNTLFLLPFCSTQHPWP